MVSEQVQDLDFVHQQNPKQWGGGSVWYPVVCKKGTLAVGPRMGRAESQDQRRAVPGRGLELRAGGEARTKFGLGRLRTPTKRLLFTFFVCVACGCVR